MIGIIQADGDDLGRGHWGQGFDALGVGRALLKGWRSKDVSFELVKLAIDHLCVKDVITSLESSDGSHLSPLHRMSSLSGPQDEIPDTPSLSRSHDVGSWKVDPTRNQPVSRIFALSPP